MTTTLLPAGRRVALAALAALPLLLAGCASLAPDNEPKVDVVGIEPLLAAGPELRLLVRLRVVNPSNTAVQYNGVYVEINVDEQSYASGVSDVEGSVPRFSETVLDVPVTVNAMAVVRQALTLAAGGRSSAIRYQLRGKLAGPVFHSHRFESSGELKLPTSSEPDDTPRH